MSISLDLLKNATKDIKNEIKKLNLLWPGAKGPEVKTLQQLLKNCGYEIQLSGWYDDKTAETVKSLQKKLGQKPNGIAGSEFFNTFNLYGGINNLKINFPEKGINKNLIKVDDIADPDKEFAHFKPTRDVKFTKEKPIKKRSNVFVSYNHNDKKFLERLQVFIAPLEKQGYINVWDDTKIAVGSLWKKEIEKSLALAKAAVLLISADFMASKFITENELPPLLTKSKKNGVQIIPVIISPCVLGKLSKYEAVNSPDHTLVEMKKGERERVWIKVVENLTGALNR
ncbi:MAG: TIR domain-containing protein [Bacteroidia bacterium]